MANNRMFLVNERLGVRICVAKYYPSSGWYVEQVESSLAERLNKSFTDDPVATMDGPTDWTIAYETESKKA